MRFGLLAIRSKAIAKGRGSGPSVCKKHMCVYPPAMFHWTPVVTLIKTQMLLAYMSCINAQYNCANSLCVLTSQTEAWTYHSFPADIGTS